MPHQEILSQYLLENGNRFNCYFTVEEALTSPGQAHTSYLQRFVSGTSISSLSKFVIMLRTDLPDALVLPDHSNPKIIHIVNRGMKNSLRYPLDQSTSVVYQGDLPGLAAAIGTQTQGTIEAGGIQTTLDATAGMDYLTQVRVNVRNLCIREILSSSIPLSGYSRILWRAVPSDTSKGGILTMYIQFYGPRPQALKLKQT